MAKMQDYACSCGNRFEFLHHPVDEVATCPECNASMSDSDRVESASKPFHVTIPMYKGSLKQKAGYVHTHGNRPAERGSVAVPSKGGSL